MNDVPTRLAIVENTLDQHEKIHLTLSESLAQVKDRLFNVLLSICFASIGIAGSSIVYIFLHGPGK